jgi:hypothetical protein
MMTCGTTWSVGNGRLLPWGAHALVLTALFAGVACHTDTVAVLMPQLAYDCPIGAATSSTPAGGTSCDALDFGVVQVGNSKTLTLRVANIGRFVLKVNSADINDDAQGTLVVSPLPSSLAVQESDNVQITFKPTFGIVLAEKYVLDTSDPSHPHVDIPIKGSGDGHPKPLADVQRLDFGNVKTGMAKFLSVRLSNQGNVPMTITSSVVTDDPAEFSSRLSSTTVAPGGSLDQPVSFLPRGVGVDTATLHLTLDAATPDGKATGTDVSEITVALSGESLSMLSVSPTPVDLGMLAWHGTTAKAVSLTNGGVAPVQIKNVALKPGGSTAITLTPNLVILGSIQPGVTAPGALTVTYTPPANMIQMPVSDVAILVIDSDDSANPHIEVPISGSCLCVRPGVIIGVSPTSIDFSTVDPRYGDRKATVTISSLGTQPLVISDIRPSPGSPIDFVAGSEIPPNTSIAAGTSQTFTITYTQHPRATTYMHVPGGIDVFSNDAMNPTVTVSLDAVCRGGPGATDIDGDGIPDVCDACQYDGPLAPTYRDNVMGDGMNFSNGLFTGQSGTRANISTAVKPGATVQVEYDFSLTGTGPQCGTHSANETQYYVGLVSGSAGTSLGTDCMFDGVPCQMTAVAPFQRQGHRQTMLTAPMTEGTYYVQYDWNWAPMCMPDQFQARGSSSGFAAFCVKK